MENFMPIRSFIGGALIGFSAVLLLWLNGRVAGVSGIFHGLTRMDRNEWAWRLSFLLGLVSGSVIYYLIPSIQFTLRTHYPIGVLILAGIIVSLGTRLGSGCTSGHGVCGMARLSGRSIAATAIFVATGMMTVYFIRHVLSLTL